MLYSGQNLPGMLLDRNEPINRGLVGFWPLNEGSGTRVNDLSDKRNPGNTINGPIWTGGNKGNIKTALSFDGTDDYVTMGNAEAMGFDRTTPFSFSFWISVRSISSQIILSKQDSTSPNPGYFLAVSSTGQMRVVMRKTITTNEIDTSTTEVMFADSAWKHVVVTYDGSSNASGVKIYVSALVRTQTVAVNNLTTSITNSIPFQLSGRNGANIPINAKIDNVRVYNRALSADEVMRLYTDPLVGLYVPNRGKYFVAAAGGSLIKSINGLAIASVKSLNGLAIASVKSRNGLANV